MRTVRRLLFLGSIVALVASSTALANHLDPEKKIRPADQARARAMLLKRADLGPGFTAVTDTGGRDPHISCPRATSEADLTLTGEAESPPFRSGFAVVVSSADVYESVADADASWRRGTGPAGETCIAKQFRWLATSQRSTLVLVRRRSFPRLAQRTIFFRASAIAQDGVTPLYFDLVALQHSRAQVAVLFASALSPMSKLEQVRLARLLAERMAKTMKGA